MTTLHEWVTDRPPTRDDADKESRVELAKYREGNSCVQVNWQQVGAGARWRPTKHWQDPSSANQLPMPNRVCCSTCRYSQAHPQAQVDMECRRHAPKPGNDTGYWPTVDPEDWCGEWEART